MEAIAGETPRGRNRSARWSRQLCLWLFAAALSVPLVAVAQSKPNPDTPSSSSAKKHSDAERLDDTYAIYSLLIPGQVLADQGQIHNQQWAIADLTIAADDMNPALAPEAALQPPPDHPRAFHQAVRDYNLHKNDRITLTRRFQLDRPYVLLTSAEVQDFRAARVSPAASADLRQQYAAYPGIISFSPVFFDAKRTVALVYMLDWCGNLCMQGEWVYLEKDGGHWVRRSGQTG